MGAVSKSLFSLKSLEKVLVRLSVSRCSRNKMATRMCQDLGVFEGWEQVFAHVVWNNTVLLSKHMQGWDLEGGLIKPIMLRTCTAETSDQDGKAEIKLWL